jgi:hypothetical protein
LPARLNGEESNEIVLGGKTPTSTFYVSIFQEIKSKGKDSRFRKAERGKFAATGVA